MEMDLGLVLKLKIGQNLRFKLLRDGGQGRLVLRIKLTWEFSGSPMVKAPCFHFTGQEFDP